MTKKSEKDSNTTSSLADDLIALGVEEEMTLIVHSSLRAIGEVDGDAPAVISALENVVGPKGTLAMPTHTGGLSDPSGWRSPPAPPETWDTIRKEMLPFQPDLTPTRLMGFIPETFRKQNGVVRSAHPQVSWAAWGRHRNAIIKNHGLEFGSGENSPLARLYELDAHVLLIGVNHSKNTRCICLNTGRTSAQRPSSPTVLQSS